MNRHKVIFLLPALALSSVVAAQPPVRPFLTLDQAEKAARACRQLAED